MSYLGGSLLAAQMLFTSVFTASSKLPLALVGSMSTSSSPGFL